MKKLLLTLFCLFAMFTVKAQCDYTLSGTDSWGDGWNGATIDIDVAGVTSSFTVSGSSNSVTIPSYTGDIVTFDFNSGSYDGEIGITLTGPDGTSLYDSGAPALDGIFITDTSASTCAPPSCSNPSSLASSNITDTTADLAWTAGGTEASWDIEVVNLSTGETATGTPTASASTNSYQATGLGSGNLHEVYVRANCGAGEVSDWIFTSFTTTGIPGCGSTVTDTGGFDGDYSSNELYEINYNSSGNLVTLNFTLVDLETCCDNLSVYDGADSSAPVLNADLTAPASFTASTEDGLTILFDSDSSVQAAGWEATLTCAPLPSCLVPTSLTASGITTTTVDLAWTNGDAETFWDIELVDITASGSVTGIPTTEDITTNPYTLSGLTAQNDYQVYLRADCSGDNSDTSDWIGPISFTTACPSFSLPFAEDFDNGGSTPNCWSQSGAENWLFNTSGPNHVGNGGTLSGSTDSGGYFAVVDASGSEANAILTSPFIDLSSLTTPMLSFYELSDNEGNSNSLLTVDVYDGSAWNTVGTYNTNTANDAWEKKEIVLDGLTFTGDAQVRFTFTEPVPGDFYDDIAIDDVSFVEAPSCANVSVITTSGVTATSVDLDWTENGTATLWDIELVDVTASGSATGTPTTDNITTNPYTLSGLTSNNDYQVYLRADCGFTGTSDWIGPVSFSTICTAVADVDENFDAALTLPDCFDSITSGGNAFFDILPATEAGNNGSNFVRLRRYTSAEISTLILPPVTTLGSNYRLTFNVNNYTATPGSVFNVGTVDAEGNFTSFQEITLSTNATWESQSIDFSTYTGTDTRVAITAGYNATSNSNAQYSDLHVDDVVWEEIPACLAISDITYTSAGTDGTSSLVSWTENGTASNYNIEVYEAGADTSTATPVYTEAVVGATNTTVTGLTAYTFYDAYVQADCGFSGASAFVMQEIYTGHCNPSSDNTIVYINSFTTTGGDTNISNTASGFSTGGYGDFRAQAITGLVQTQSFDVAFVNDGTYGGKMYAWVDWNNDLAFDNTAGSSEIVLALEAGNYASGSFTVTIPDGQAAGDFVLRIKVEQAK